MATAISSEAPGPSWATCRGGCLPLPEQAGGEWERSPPGQWTRAASADCDTARPRPEALRPGSDPGCPPLSDPGAGGAEGERRASGRPAASRGGGGARAPGRARFPAPGTRGRRGRGGD